MIRTERIQFNMVIAYPAVSKTRSEKTQNTTVVKTIENQEMDDLNNKDNSLVHFVPYIQ